ncbi:hypothetical protein QYF36_009036 [Acer negundo]|nr:hypothetical protein QYF36_009036 [Acer negundo]
MELIAMLSWGVWFNRNMVMHNKHGKDTEALVCWAKYLLAKFLGTLFALLPPLSLLLILPMLTAVALHKGLELARQHGVPVSWIDAANVAAVVNCSKSLSGHSSSPPPLGIVSSKNEWRPPPLGGLKLDTYAIILHEGSSFGIGVVIRDSEGKVVLALLKFLQGCFSVEVCEALALREGLCLAKQHGLSVGWV